MADSSKEVMGVERRRQIFQEELEVLWEKRLIPKSEYLRISRAYDRQAQLSLFQEKRRNQVQAERESLNKSQELENEKLMNKGEETVDSPFSQIPVPEKEEPDSKNALKEGGQKKEPDVRDRLEPVMASTPKLDHRPVQKEKVIRPEKPKKTPEQIRERNISVVLLTGVILLLFGGLILATSSWGDLNAAWKVFFIGMVSVVFAGMAFLAYKLSIKQTSFAFLTLASLFIPITILSASYYKIFGEYLSLDGGGRGLLGFLGGVLCLGIYYKIAAYFKSKTFIFISILTFAVTCYFGFAYLTPTFEWMFLVVSTFNLLLVWNVEQLKNREVLALFKPYIFRFVEFKIIVESIVVLTLFSSNLVYSITLLVISILFLILAVKFHQKYLEIAFNLVFTYGYIHFVSNSALRDYTVLAYASIPLIFLALSVYMDKKKEPRLAKNFKVTSLIESGIVFFYINAMAYQEHYAQIFFALMILCAQLVYVSLRTNNRSFTYPAYAVFNVACYYLCLAFSLSFSTILNVMFLLQVILYLGLYVFNRHARYKVFKQSVLLISSFILVGILTSKLSEMAWLEVGIGLVILSGLFFLTYLKDDEQAMKEASVYGFPLAFTGGLVAFYPDLVERSDWFHLHVTISLHLMVVALISIAAGYALKKSFGMFFSVFFYSGQVLSFLSFLLVGYGMSRPLEVTGLLMVATIINGWSVYLHRSSLYWLPVVITSAALYGSLFDVFDFTETSYQIAFVLFGPIIFLLIGEGIGKYSQTGRRYFLYSSHLANLIAIPVGFFLIMLTDCSPFLFITQTLIYLSALRTKVKWERFVFTYLGFTVMLLQVRLFFMDVGQTRFVDSICMMITSGVIAILWVASQKQWKHIIELYLIPFLSITAAVSISETSHYGFPLVWAFIWIGLVTVQLVFIWYLLMHRNWQNAVVVPLGMFFILYRMYADTLSMLPGILVLLACVVVMVFLSKRYFTSLIKQGEKGSFIDFYRIFGFLFLLDMAWRVSLGGAEFEMLNMFVSILLPAYFFLMRIFTIGSRERSIYSGIAAVIGLYPFSTIWDYADTLPLLWGSVVLFFGAVVMLLLSRHYFKGLIKKNESGMEIDAFRVYGLLFIVVMNLDIYQSDQQAIILECFVSLLIPIYFLLVRSMTYGVQERKWYVAASIVTSLYPYWVIIDKLPIPDVLELEADIFPLFVVSSILLRKVFNKGRVTQYIEMGVVVVLFIIMIADAMASNTLDDALVIGSVSLAAILLGFTMKYKSYFLAGTVTILFNIYMNTNSMWGQMPWWLYLIIGGGVLISIASFFEWKKQKDNRTSKEVLEKNKQRIKNWFNRWN